MKKNTNTHSYFSNYSDISILLNIVMFVFFTHMNHGFIATTSDLFNLTLNKFFSVKMVVIEFVKSL